MRKIDLILADFYPKVLNRSLFRFVNLAIHAYSAIFATDLT